MKKNLILLILLAIVTAVVAFLYFTRSSKSFDDSYADFSVKDTASVDRIYIADHAGNSVLLSRKKGKWLLNDTIEPRMDAIDLLLRVFRDITIQSPIAASSQEHFVKVLAANHRKVEIYQGGDEPSKIWYVGPATQDHFGTYMLLEIPGRGKSQKIYIADVPWHKGFLTPMFFTTVKDWRDNYVFRYPELDFRRVSVKNFREPGQSFAIEQDKGRIISVKDSKDQPAGNLDTLMVKEYLQYYRVRGFEKVDTSLTTSQKDSLLRSVPLFEITVTGRSGNTRNIRLYQRLKPATPEDPEVQPGEIDKYMMVGYVNNREWVLIPYTHFEPLMLRMSDFSKQSN